jgi:subtilisin family serine protease
MRELGRMTRSRVSMTSLVALACIVMASTSSAEQAEDAKRLRVDEAYYSSMDPMQPGTIADSPEPYELTADDPRALRPGRVSVLVHMDPVLDRVPANRANVKTFATQRGGVVKHEYGVVMPNLINLRDIPQSAVEALKKMRGVARVELDEYHADLLLLHDGTALINGLQSQISAAGLSANGSGVRVCVCDTGIDSDHLMYSSRIDTSAGHDFYNDDNDPEDDNGHGSHVAGIAVGGTGLSVDFGCGAGDQDFQGIAPEATLIGAKILNSGGGGFDSDIIAGIDHCADQSPSGGRADVINLSIGIGQFTGNCTHSWAVAANNAVASGVVVVAASGNENFSNALSSPACGVNVIAVGATWKADYPTCEDNTTNWNWGVCVDSGPQTDEVGCFSNESDNLDVSAPGLNIWSASNAAGGSSIAGQSGTSMASPAVAGLAALILDADASLTPAEVRQLIRDGATDLGAAGFDRGYGFGRIDVVNTLSLLGPCTGPSDCDDGDACTNDDCVSGACVFTPSSPCCGNGSCESGEDCNSCSSDCVSGTTGSGAVCNNGICEAGDGEDCVSCPADCNGKLNGNPNNRFCCGDGDGPNPLPCSDSACSSGGWSCTDVPSGGGSSYCCGDGSCDTGEDEANCASDCAITCNGPSDCNDGVACTVDDCVGGVCDNTPDDGSCDDGLFCNGTESCDSGSGCVSSGNPCSGNETCNESNDTCESDCLSGGSSCSQNSDCCSNKCRGGSCRGN